VAAGQPTAAWGSARDECRARSGRLEGRHRVASDDTSAFTKEPPDIPTQSAAQRSLCPSNRRTLAFRDAHNHTPPVGGMRQRHKLPRPRSKPTRPGQGTALVESLHLPGTGKTTFIAMGSDLAIQLFFRTHYAATKGTDRQSVPISNFLQDRRMTMIMHRGAVRVTVDGVPMCKVIDARNLAEDPRVHHGQGRRRIWKRSSRSSGRGFAKYTREEIFRHGSGRQLRLPGPRSKTHWPTWPRNRRRCRSGAIVADSQRQGRRVKPTLPRPHPSGSPAPTMAPKGPSPKMGEPRREKVLASLASPRRRSGHVRRFGRFA